MSSHYVDEATWVAELLGEMERDAAEAGVPILNKNGKRYYEEIVKEQQPHRILEVGTAIGYSALLALSLAPEDATIVTIESDAARARAAELYFSRTLLGRRVHQILGDARSVLPKLLEDGEKYDFIFLDAAKGQYPNYFRTVAPMLAPGGCIVADNVLFRGYVRHPVMTPRRFDTIVERLQEYLELAKNPPFATKVFDKGDGLALTWRPDDKKETLVVREKKQDCKKRKPELLAPAGTFEKMKMAFAYGADAVYLGGKFFGLRALGGNFTKEELKEAVCYAHERQKKIYVTVNIFPHDDEFLRLKDYLIFLESIHADAILVADLGVFQLAREIAPELSIHVSTQANTVNAAAVRAWKALGAERVVLARELSLKEIAAIRSAVDIELEMFVHGAMCISMSGRCLLSAYFTGRDANRGACAQSCRWRYALVEEKRPNEYFPIAEDERGTYLMNSKDLCLLPHLKDVIGTGVDSLKIEGRMKSVHYVASVTKAYRQAIDAYANDPAHFAIDPAWTEELGKVSHRPYTAGFALHETTADDQIYGSSSYEQTSDFIGLVRSYDAATGWATVEQRNHMRVGEEIELFQPTLGGFRQVLAEMTDEAGAPIDRAPHPQQIVRIRMAHPVEPQAILRRDL